MRRLGLGDQHTVERVLMRTWQQAAANCVSSRAQILLPPALQLFFRKGLKKLRPHVGFAFLEILAAVCLLLRPPEPAELPAFWIRRERFVLGCWMVTGLMQEPLANPV
jgi:hypothetical protein